LVGSTDAHGEDEIRGPITIAAGRTAAASPLRNDAITANPSLLALVERYDMEGEGGIGDGGWEAGGSIVDSRQSALAMGVAYRRLIHEPALTDDDLPGWFEDGETPSNVKRYHDIAVGVALPFWERRVSLGVGGVVSFTDHDRHDPSIVGNLDVGTAFAPLEWLTVGVVGRNLLPLGQRSELPLALLGGVRLAHEDIGAFAFELDERLGAVDSRRLSIRVGAEKSIRSLDLRAGWHDENGEFSAITWGLGAHNEQGSFDYAMEVPLEGPFRFEALLFRLGICIRA
jgi:hypothetical protein